MKAKRTQGEDVTLYRPTKPEMLRTMADEYDEIARKAEADGHEFVAIGAVNATVEQLRRWVKQCRATANELERQRAAEKSMQRLKRGR